MMRVTSLYEPPVVGNWYLVPTVEWPWLGSKAASVWPVFLPKHDDAEHLNFADPHYHVDPRFLDAAGCRLAADWAHDFMEATNRALETCQRMPVSRRNGETRDLPAVVWRRRKCRRATAEYVHADKPIILKLNNAFAGRQCKRARSGWVCPHQHFPLGSVKVEHGVQTCPLHGLRIRAADGVILAPRESA